MSVDVDPSTQPSIERSILQSHSDMLLQYDVDDASHSTTKETKSPKQDVDATEGLKATSTLPFDTYRDAHTPSSSLAGSRIDWSGGGSSVLWSTQPATTQTAAPSSMLSSPIATTSDLDLSSVPDHRPTTPPARRAPEGVNDSPDPLALSPARVQKQKSGKITSGLPFQIPQRASARSRKPSEIVLLAQANDAEDAQQAVAAEAIGRSDLAASGGLIDFGAEAIEDDAPSTRSENHPASGPGRKASASVQTKLDSLEEHGRDSASDATDSAGSGSRMRGRAAARLSVEIPLPKPRRTAKTVPQEIGFSDTLAARRPRRTKKAEAEVPVSNRTVVAEGSSHSGSLPKGSPKRPLRQARSAKSVDTIQHRSRGSSGSDEDDSVLRSPKKRARKAVDVSRNGQSGASTYGNHSSVALSDQEDNSGGTTLSEVEDEEDGESEEDEEEEEKAEDSSEESDSDAYDDSADPKGKKKAKATKSRAATRGKAARPSKDGADGSRAPLRTPEKPSKVKSRARAQVASKVPKTSRALPTDTKSTKGPASPKKKNALSASSSTISPCKAVGTQVSPLKSSYTMPAGSQTAFRQKDATVAVAPRETKEQQAEGWSLGKLERLIWVFVKVGRSGFWWPADIVSILRSERPLKVETITGDPHGLEDFLSGSEILIDDPSPINMLSFRIGPRVRFGRDIFTEHESGDDGAHMPTKKSFDQALDKAVEIETERAYDINSETETEEENDEEDTDTAERITSKAKERKKTSAAKKKTTKARRGNAALEEESDAEDPLEALGLGASSQMFEDDPDEDDLLQSEDEDLGFAANSIVVARRKPRDEVWWPARFLRYEPAQADGKRVHKGGKFIVEWTTGKVEGVIRGCILSSSQKEYRTVPLGETLLKLPKDYAATLTNFTQDLDATFERIIEDEYLPAKEWNRLFFEGGKTREHLAQKARFGELEQPHLESIQRAIGEWAEGKNGARPIGCADYEALEEVERSRYNSDVLLTMAVYLVTIHEHDFEIQAEKELVAEDSSAPSQDEILVRAFTLADAEFDRGSVTKAVHSARINTKKNRR